MTSTFLTTELQDSGRKMDRTEKGNQSMIIIGDFSTPLCDL